MVPAAGALLWALLLSLGSPAAGAQGQAQTPSGLQRVSFRLGGPLTRSYQTSSRSSGAWKTKVTLEDEDDAVATADRLAGPAASELLASSVATGISHPRGSGEEEGALEEEVVINARRNGPHPETPPQTAPSTLFPANTQEREVRLTTSLVPSTDRSAPEPLGSEATTLSQWSTAGATPNRWPPPSATAMPPAEDLRLVLMPWGPWHCHCKSGTMSRSRSGKLQGLSGRLRAGALSQIRTEHRPCTYQQCPCRRDREECPLDRELCEDCASQASPSRMPVSRTSSPSPSPSPSPALAFWKRVRIGLEDIWNSLSSVFTEMQPVSV
ncbi:protein MENT [Trichechus manatus latirostris]|uniref:Protein MENT n=1 Tax=Trichechus manatus latirostris TaxID=127582 RepID=A0A2Y9G1T9_TRIMA|nr:protein MENT [Trichechus manatus latirostris]